MDNSRLEHETYWTIARVPGNSMPPYRRDWQKFPTTGYNLAADKFLIVTIACTVCKDTLAPTPEPTDIPTRSPTSLPTCEENYITLIGCFGEDFEGIYERQENKKNGKNHYFNRNGYSVYYVQEEMFANHGVCQSPDDDYFILLSSASPATNPF